MMTTDTETDDDVEFHDCSECPAKAFVNAIQAVCVMEFGDAQLDHDRAGCVINGLVEVLGDAVALFIHGDSVVECLDDIRGQLADAVGAARERLNDLDSHEGSVQ